MSVKTKKVLKIVGNSIFYLFIGLLLIFSIMNLRAGSTGENFANIFGRGYLTVSSKSMSSDYDISDKGIDSVYFEVEDLIIVKSLDEEDKANLKIGDVITFYDQELKALNTHRIVYINGSTVYTQGNADVYIYKPFDTVNISQNATDELTGSIKFQTVSMTDVKGLYLSTNRSTGHFISWLSNPSATEGGFLYVIVLPTILFLIYQIVFVVLNVIALKNKKASDETIAIDAEARIKQEEELRAQIRAELEAKMREELLSKNKDSDEEKK